MMSLKLFAKALVRGWFAVLLILATIITLVSGWIGWSHVLSDSSRGWSDVAFFTVRAFAFGDEYVEFPGGTEAQAEAFASSVALQIARFGGAFVAFGTVIRLVFAVLSRRLRYLAAWARHGHAVVLGDAVIARKFAEIWAGSRRRPVSHHTSQQEGIWDGILTLPRNARLDEGLTCLSTDFANRVIVAENDDSQTSETALALSAQRPATTVFALLRDPWLAEHIRHTVETAPVGEWKGDHLIPISEYASAARVALIKHPPYMIARSANQSVVHLLIAGYNAASEALLRDVLHSCVVSEDALGISGFRFTILDPDAMVSEDRFQSRYPGYFSQHDVTFISGNPSTPNQKTIKELAARFDVPVTAAYVCAEGMGTPLDTALGLQEFARRVPGFSGPIFVRTPDGSGLPSHAGGVRFRLPCDIIPYGVWDETLQAGGLLAREPDALAIAHHEAYRKMLPMPGSPANVPWAQLEERFRNSNRRAVAHIPAKLASLGFDITPLMGAEFIAPEKMPTIHPNEKLFRNATELRNLARLEHERWAADRLVDGWTYAAERNNAARLHPNLQPFDKLSLDVQNYDVKLVAALESWIKTDKRSGLKRRIECSSPPDEREEDKLAVAAAGVSLR